METLSVALGSRAYPIHIGAGILDAAELYRPHLADGAAAIVTNAVVAPLYLEKIRHALKGTRVTEVVIGDGEQSKSWRGVEQVVDALLAARLGRDGLVVALGGGVIGDLAGFAAAVYQRGVPFIRCRPRCSPRWIRRSGARRPINHALGKNMIGAFHQPARRDLGRGDARHAARPRAALGSCRGHQARLRAGRGIRGLA
jgi:3-dehydroquinate synthase